MGNVAGFIHCTSTVVDGGSPGSIRCTSACTRCTATCMLVPQANCAEISLDPREVTERTSCIPGTRRIASSRGRVAVGIIVAAGSLPTLAITLTSGKVTSGKMDDGSPSTRYTPAAASSTTSR